MSSLILETKLQIPDAVGPVHQQNILAIRPTQEESGISLIHTLQLVIATNSMFVESVTQLWLQANAFLPDNPVLGSRIWHHRVHQY